MYLRQLQVQRLRSIEDTTLLNCADFNVLIGKNNAGKSTVLTAIEVFFQCLKSENLISLAPSVGREIDFHNRNLSEPITIEATFSLSLGERDLLLGDIVSELPQMKNAIDGIEASLDVVITLDISRTNVMHGLVRSIVLVTSFISGAARPSTGRKLLSVGASAASELLEVALAVRGGGELADAIALSARRTDSGDWRRIKTEGRGASYLSMVYDHEMSASAVSALDALAREATTLEEFQQAARDRENALRQSISKRVTEPLRASISTFAGESHVVPGYVKALLQRVAAIPILHLADRRKPIGREEAVRLLSLKTRRGGPEKLRLLQDTVSGLLGVQIDAFESAPYSAGRRLEPSAELDVDNFLVEVNGSGIQESLRLILDVHFGQPKVLLVEEPEVHLHPAIETSMMRFLRTISRGCQVFLTTHSTNFVDHADVQNIYLVTKESATNVQLLSLDEAEARIPRELGLRLSSLFMFDRLVFVEGSSDEDVIREWATTLSVNLATNNVGFVAMGGVRNFGHFANAQTLSLLSRRQVSLTFLLDRDEQDDSDVQQLEQRLGGLAKLHVLNRRELENYLLVPRAILELIRIKRISGGGALVALPEPTESEIGEALDEVAETLKKLSVDKRVIRRMCRPIYPSVNQIIEDSLRGDTASVIQADFDALATRLVSLKADVPEAVLREQRAVDGSWSVRKLQLVPGDLLLDGVLRKYGLRFSKVRDSSRLASFLARNEIDPEIVSLIEGLASG